MPFLFNKLNKISKTGQLCNYEMRNSKWKGFVFCTNHGVRLCTENAAPRHLVEPKLYKLDNSEVTDYSWCSPDTFLEDSLIASKLMLVKEK